MENLKDILHAILDFAKSRYEGSEVDLRAQIDALGAEALADVVEDIEKLAKNG